MRHSRFTRLLNGHGGSIGPVRRSLWRVAGAALCGLLVALVLVDAPPPWAFASLGSLAVAILIMESRIAAFHPHDRVGPANVATLVRLVFALFILGAFFAPEIAREHAWGLVAIGLAALLTDGVDGYLARRTGMASAFGRRLDMEVDAALILVLCLLAVALGKTGYWILAIGLMRYAWIGAARMLPWLERPLPESLRRKTVCVIQVVALLLVNLPWVGAAPASAIAASSLVLLAWSFLVDIRWCLTHRHA
ncbi:MAG: CDP-alcohol phosphatidyltransferase family protein [Azospirillaceae bacterium]